MRTHSWTQRWAGGTGQVSGVDLPPAVHNAWNTAVLCMPAYLHACCVPFPSKWVCLGQQPEPVELRGGSLLGLPPAPLCRCSSPM
jgi:hypothetical protein